MGALEESLLTNEHLIASHPYYYDYLTWCVQKAKPMPLWKSILRICTDPVVYAVFTLHGVIITAMCYVIQQFERHQKWDLFRISVNGFKVYVGYGCSYKPKNFSNRLGASFVYIGAFLFDAILCTKVITFTTTPIYGTQVKSITEAIEGGFQFVGDRFAYQKISEQNQVTTDQN